jgi:hypothetical protein
MIREWQILICILKVLGLMRKDISELLEPNVAGKRGAYTKDIQ